jgi:sugar phosphate isomerase/epimerase
MKLGFLMRFDAGRIAFARQHGCTCAALVVKPDDRFLPIHAGWESEAAKVRDAYAAAGLEISSLECMYQNILDPARTEELSAIVRASVKLAGALGVRVLGCLAGRLENQPLENSLPAYKTVWGELGRLAADHGMRIAFENCPKGPFHQPPGGNNFLCTPAIWERAFSEVPLESLGLEWDPSHLVCLFIDPVENLRQFGKKVFHIHAKDARVDRANLAKHGIWHPQTSVHCFPGLGDSDWAAMVRELKAQGYQGALDIEGWHDPVYRGEREDEGLLIAIRHLQPLLTDC